MHYNKRKCNALWLRCNRKIIFKHIDMKTYKGFEIEKGRESYIIGTSEYGQITHDNAQPKTIKECKIVINEFLKGNLNPVL